MEDFLQSLHRAGPDCRTIVLSGGNGISKSATLAIFFIGLLLPRYTMMNPWLARMPFFVKREKWAQFYGPNQNHDIALIIRRDTIDKVLMRQLERWAPRDSFVPEKGDKHFVYEVRFHGGGILSIFTPNQDIKQFEGGNYDIVAADEPFPLPWYGVGLKRSRGKGLFISVMTPKWDSNAGMFINEVKQMPEEERIYTRVVLDTACKECGERGFRAHKEIEADKKSTRPSEYKATVLGMEMALAGKVLTEFDPVVNVISEDQAIEWIREDGCSWYVGIDPHNNLPHLLGIAARLKDGRIIFVDEWPRWVPGVEFNRELTSEAWLEYYLASQPVMFHKLSDYGAKNPDQFVRIVKKIELDVIERYCGGYDRNGIPTHKKVGTRILHRYTDPNSAATKPASSNLTLQELWWQCGLQITPSRAGKDLKGGHELINKLLGGSINEDGLNDPPMMFFVDKCNTLIYHAFNFSNKVEESKSSAEGTLSVGYNEDFKHGVDVARYIVQMNPMFFDSDAILDARKANEPQRPQRQGFFADV